MYIKTMGSEIGDTQHHKHVDTPQYRKNNAWDLFPTPFQKRLIAESADNKIVSGAVKQQSNN